MLKKLFHVFLVFTFTYTQLSAGSGFQSPKIIETPSEVDGLNDMSISFSEEEDLFSDDTH